MNQLVRINILQCLVNDFTCDQSDELSVMTNLVRCFRAVRERRRRQKAGTGGVLSEFRKWGGRGQKATSFPNCPWNLNTRLARKLTGIINKSINKSINRYLKFLISGPSINDIIMGEWEGWGKGRGGRGGCMNIFILIFLMTLGAKKNKHVGMLRIVTF